MATTAPALKAFDQVRHTHPQTPDIEAECRLLASWSNEAAEKLEPFTIPVLQKIQHQNNRQKEWLLTRTKQAAPQVLVVPSAG